MEIKADVKTISELKDYFFLVPDYQREYVWKPDDQVEQFIIDIENEYQPKAKTQNSYFIGSIIIVDNNGKFDVIDGQQRLTTIILSLCAFRDILKPIESTLDLIGKEYLKSIESLLFSFDLKTKKPTYRLELQYEESKGFLKTLIESKQFVDTKTSSVNKMQSAYDKLKNQFQNYYTEDAEDFIEYVSYFLTKIELVIIKSENLSSALKIFETINQRGAGLNAMDLVKNLLFSKASEADFQKIKETWKELTYNLQLCREDNSPLRFLRYFLMARYHDGVLREDDIYKWFITPEGKKITQYEQNPLEFAIELKKASKRYSDLILATELMTDGGAFPNNTNIGFINKYKSRQQLVLLLALDVNCSNDLIEYLAAQIESFFFYSNSLGIQSKYNEYLFASWASKLRGVNSLDTIKDIVENTMVPYVKERLGKFRSDFLNINHEAYNPLYRLRFVLGKIENTILAKSGLPIKGKDFIYNLQVEHILPQTPKNDALTAEFKDHDEYRNIVHKLGNTTLLESSINQAVNNFNDLNSNWFELKQAEYLNSNIITTNLLNDDFSIGNNTGLNRFKADYKYSFTEWNKDSIAKRQIILLELALDTWKFNDKRIDK